jgi:hypothetical protein
VVFAITALTTEGRRGNSPQRTQSFYLKQNVVFPSPARRRCQPFQLTDEVGRGGLTNEIGLFALRTQRARRGSFANGMFDSWADYYAKSGTP